MKFEHGRISERTGVVGAPTLVGTVEMMERRERGQFHSEQYAAKRNRRKASRSSSTSSRIS